MDGDIDSYGGAALPTPPAQPSTPQTNGYFLVTGDSSTLTFNNAGTFNAQAGAGITATDDGVTFTNSGTVSVASGTLYLDDPGGTDSGPFTVAKGATLDFDETAATLTLDLQHQRGRSRDLQWRHHHRQRRLQPQHDHRQHLGAGRDA